MNFYKHHIGDYAQATAHLSFVEDAAYSRMLRKYYAEEAPLPADVAKVIRLVGARTREEKQAVQTILDEFFTLEADGWHNKRADAELAEAKEQEGERDAKKENERERQRIHREERKEVFAELRSRGIVPQWDTKMEVLRAMLNQAPVTPPVTVTAGDTSQPVTPPVTVTAGDTSQPVTPPVTCTATANQTPDARHQTPIQLQPPPSKPPAQPSVLDCPQSEILALYAKHLPMLRQPRVWEGARADKLRTRWRYCAKPNGIGSGYRTQGEGIAFWEQFFAFVAKSKKLTDGIRYEDGTRWKPDLPWLLEPENFAKVVEGKFHEEPRA